MIVRIGSRSRCRAQDTSGRKSAFYRLKTCTHVKRGIVDLRRAAQGLTQKVEAMSKLQAWRAVQAPWKAVKRAHGFIQKTLFEGEAPTLYRLKANKYAHCYGAPKRGANRSLQHLAPYLAGAVLAGMATFFVVLPLSFNRSYEASKQRYEAFARQNAQHAELLERQYDRGQFARRRE